MQKITGMVVAGKKEARTLGYPTANIEYNSDQRLEEGVWTCLVTLPDQSMNMGAAVVGMWLQADGHPSVEVYVLDFTGDLYGQELILELKEKLHENKFFPKREDLIKQIEDDITKTRKRFPPTRE